MSPKVKHNLGIALRVVIILAVAFLYYYNTLPALNIHSKGLWGFLIFMIVVCDIWWIIRRYRTMGYHFSKGKFRLEITVLQQVKIGLIALGSVLVVFIVANLASSTLFNAKRYQQLIKVETRDFVSDIKQVDYSTIPLLDRDSASLLGDKKMGSMVDIVSQFEVSDEYTQINYNGKPVRVTPLKYASIIKWFTNHSEGVPAYILIDMASQETQCVKLEQPIRYSESEHFGRYIKRHLRFRFPTYIFDDEIFFEIDDNGTPYWVCPVVKYNIGLFGGKTIGRVVLCNASTGECYDYAVD